MTRHACVTADIPQNALEVVVTHVVNPYYIQLHEVQGFREKIHAIGKNLQGYLERYAKNPPKCTPQIKKHDFVILSVDKIGPVELPNWICRAIVTKTTELKSTVLLMDYGIVLEDVPTNSLIAYTTKYISAEPLSRFVSMNNIIPTETKNLKFAKSRHSKSNIDLCLGENNQWPEKTVQFIRELMASAKTVFYDIEVYDKEKEKMYGEFYLVIDHQNISLSKVLIHRFMAVTFTKEISDALETCDMKTNSILVPYEIKNGCFLTSVAEHETIVTNSESMKTSSTVATRGLMNVPTNVPHNPIPVKKKVIVNESLKDKIMVQSIDTCRRLESIGEAVFETGVSESLTRNGVVVLRTIQSYMWPAITQGLNVVAINPKESGKSSGYVVPVSSYVATIQKDLIEQQRQEVHARPVALILCSNVEKVVSVFEKFRMTLRGHRDIRVVNMYNGLGDDKIMTRIYNKPHILISTPPFLLRFMEKYPNKINLSKLSFLVLDHAEIVLQKYQNEFFTMMKNYGVLNQERQYSVDEKKMQIVAVGLLWTEDMEIFVEKFMENPFICIGSFVEAAAYRKVSAKMSLRDIKQKNKLVLDSLGDYTMTKTVIVCLVPEEVEALNKFLQSHDVKTLMSHEAMSSEVGETTKAWKEMVSGSYAVLICTDDVLSDLRIYDAQFLIHYKITETSKTRFNYRFSVLMDNLIEKQNIKCKVLIIADNSTNVQFEGLIKILQRLGTDIPDDWYKISKGITAKLNMDKKKIPLCTRIRQFGICENSSCIYRHCVIQDVDAPAIKEISIGDNVRLKINAVHSATHFSARVLEYVKDGKRQPIPNRHVWLHSKIQQYFKDPNNRHLRSSIEVGDYCVMAEDKAANKTYSRVMVLEIVQRKPLDDSPTFVKVKVLDVGGYLDRVSVHYLYEIPQDFLEAPSNIVDVFISNVAPFDDENDWNRTTSQAIFDWLKGFKEESYAFGKVVLQLGSNIWLDTMDIRTDVPGYAAIPSNYTIKDFIVKNGHGQLTDKHLKELEKLCQT